MAEENLSHELSLKDIEETRNYFIKKIDQNELMSKKHKKVCATLNYIKQFLVLVSQVTRFISVSVFGYLLDIPIGITASAVG